MERERPKPDGKVRVNYGATEVDLEGFVDREISELRSLAEASLDVPEGVRILAGGHPVGEDYVIKSGEVLEFVHEAGKKG